MKRRKTISLVLLLTGITFLIPKAMDQAQDGKSMPAPPVTEKKPKVTEINGDKLVDNYFWLREKSNPAVIAHLEAENAYTDTAMKPTAALQDTLYKEMLGHIKQTDEDVPYRWGEYFYFTRTEEGKQYPIFCRKKGSVDAKEVVIL